MRFRRLLVAIIFSINPLAMPSAFADCDDYAEGGWLEDECFGSAKQEEAPGSGSRKASTTGSSARCEEAGRAASAGCEATTQERLVSNKNKIQGGISGGISAGLKATKEFNQMKSSQMSRCNQLVAACQEACGDNIEACSAGAEKGAQAAAEKKAAEGGEGGMEMLSALAGLAGLFMKKKDAETASTETETAEDTSPADTPSATGGLTSRSGYRPYQSSDVDTGEANAPSFKGNLVDKKGSGGVVSGSNAGRGSPGVNPPGGGRSGSGSRGVATASEKPSEAFDTQLSSGFYKGGSGPTATASSAGYSSGSGSSRRNRRYGTSISNRFAGSASKLKAVLNRARSLGRAPASMVSHNGGAVYGDNFTRIRERYKRMNSSEALEEIK